MRFFRVKVLRTVPHAGQAFTQGLLAEGDTVWESGGQYGMSVLRRYQFGSADVAAEAWLPPELFAEGICRVGPSIWQLTWRERVALRWDAETLEVTGRVRFNREGWGICAVPVDNRLPVDSKQVESAAVDNAPASARTVDNRGITPVSPVDIAVSEIVTSDGSSELVRRDPDTLEPRAIVPVRCEGARVRWLNDLAWSGGRIWANVLGTTCLAGIDLDTGELTDVVDARAAGERRVHPQELMNGIAALGPDEFLLTGTGWRKVRHVRLTPDRDRGQLDRMLAGARELLHRG